MDFRRAEFDWEEGQMSWGSLRGLERVRERAVASRNCGCLEISARARAALSQRRLRLRLRAAGQESQRERFEGNDALGVVGQEARR
jgi:hypothetical protein